MFRHKLNPSSQQDHQQIIHTNRPRFDATSPSTSPFLRALSDDEPHMSRTGILMSASSDDPFNL